jgi:hypothetical protein
MGADRIQQGPINSAGTNPYDTQAIVMDSLNADLYVSGQAHITHVLHKSMLVLNAQTALTNITAAQNLLSVTLNAGRLNYTNRTLRVKLFILSTAAATPGGTVAVTLGGTTLCSVSLGALPASSIAVVEFTLTVASLGATGTIESHAWSLVGPGNAGSGGFNDTNSAVSSAINLLGALTLTANISGGATIASAQLRQATVELVN